MVGIGDPRLKSSYPLNVKFFEIGFNFGIGNGFSSWAGIEEVETDSCDLSSSKSLSTSISDHDLSLSIISLYLRSSKSSFKSISDHFRVLNRSFRSKSDCELDSLGICDLLEPKGVTLVGEDEGVTLVREDEGVTLVREDEGVTLVREDEGDGVVGGEVDGVVILVGGIDGEGDGGIDKGIDGGGGPCGPGNITNPAGIFIPPAKLSLISFNNLLHLLLDN